MNLTATVTVSFPISNAGEGQIERLHAVRIGENRFILDNSPFYVYGISCCDEFEADYIEGDFIFSHVVSRGGHSTYRVKIPSGKEHSYFMKFWEEFAKAGCTFEGSSMNVNRLYSIDVPPGADIHKIYQRMQEIEDQGIWEFEEGHYCCGESAT